MDNKSRTGDVHAFKVLRVCHNSNFNALYELSLGCAGVVPAFNTRISGKSVVEDFAGTSGTSVVLSTNRPMGSTKKLVYESKYDGVYLICVLQFDAIATEILSEDNGFDRRLIGPVRQLQWQDGAGVIYAITNTSVSCKCSFRQSIQIIILSYY